MEYGINTALAVESMEATAIEIDFPISELSKLAEQESWRKEVHRPIYHIHKWWAQRLGSVFRAITLGALSGVKTDLWNEFYDKHDFSDKVVLDPFMGSGTTLGEAAKLGAKPIGIDINPVSSFIVTQALTRVDLGELEKTFAEIERDVKNQITKFYTTLDPETGKKIPVLYSFWVKEVALPDGEIIPLFSSFVFSKDAYPKKKPNSKILCPSCWNINDGRYDAEELSCKHCRYHFNPQVGPVRGAYVYSPSGEKFRIKDLIQKQNYPPSHQLYAILALREDCTKIYLRPTEFDYNLIEEASFQLATGQLPLPDMPIRPGHNTDQARGYNYHNWADFFSERQLLCLGLLLKRILQVENKAIREQFVCLFSGSLEFNNFFCSFKGEGTGAVRHLFSNHILKPERTPLENSVWGTEKSSGTFSSLYQSRLLKAKRYLDSPTELFVPVETDGFFSLNGSVNGKMTSSSSINLKIKQNWLEFEREPRGALILNGDGGELPLPEKCVDAVVTDPPYFDFVHYSELSDFFFAWLKPALENDYDYFAADNSSHVAEVQDRDSDGFIRKLTRVFLECRRVLKDDGVLAFTFHHSRHDGWLSIYEAVFNAGFQIVAAHPIHGEMKGGSPKSATKEPITLDAILVCRKKHYSGIKVNTNVIQLVREKSLEISKKLRTCDLPLTQADNYVVLMSQAIATGSSLNYSRKEMQDFLKSFDELR